jgi:hypothetical protein
LLDRLLDELVAEAHRTLAEAWKERERLGSEPASALDDFFNADTRAAGGAAAGRGPAGGRGRGSGPGPSGRAPGAQGRLGAGGPGGLAPGLGPACGPSGARASPPDRGFAFFRRTVRFSRDAGLPQAWAWAGPKPQEALPTA